MLDILREPLSWSTTTRAIASKLTNQDAVLISVGPVRAADSLRKEMINMGVKTFDSFDLQALPESQSPNISGDIAIVGVAGRMPGGETLEAIWKTLEEGKDLHKKVGMRCHTYLHSLTFGRYLRIGLTWTLIAIHPGRSRTRL